MRKRILVRLVANNELAIGVGGDEDERPVLGPGDGVEEGDQDEPGVEWWWWWWWGYRSISTFSDPSNSLPSPTIEERKRAPQTRGRLSGSPSPASMAAASSPARPAGTSAPRLRRLFIFLVVGMVGLAEMGIRFKQTTM